MTTSFTTHSPKTLAISSLLPLTLLLACTVPGSSGPMGQAADAAPEVDAPAEYQISPPTNPGIVRPPEARPLPMYVSARQVDPRYLAFAQDSPYWVDDSFGKRGLRTEGIGEHETLSDMAFDGKVVASASNESGVYWASTERGLYFNSWKDGTPLEIDRFDTVPLDIAVSDKYIYWLSASGCLGRLDANGEKVRLACAPGLPEHLALAESAAYWTTDEGFLYEFVFAPENQARVVAKGRFVSRIVADDSGVYWYDGATRQLFGYDRTSGVIDPLAVPQRAMSEIAQDRFYLYFSTPTDGGVKRVLKTGTEEVEVMALNQPGPTEIVVSSKAVYWVNAGDGTIMHLPTNYNY